MASGYVRARRETTSIGTQAGAAGGFGTKTLYYAVREFQPTPGVEHLTRDDELRGNNFPVAAIPNLYNPAWSVDHRGYPDHTAYSLVWTLGLPTTTAGNGTITDPDGTAIPTGAYRHVWTSPFGNGVAAVNPPTMDLDIAYADQSTYFKARGAAVNTLEIANPDDDATGITLNGPATYLEETTSPGLTAALESLSIKPFSRANLTTPTWLSGTGTHQNIGLTITRNVEQVRSMGATNTAGWPDTLEYTNDPIGTVVTGTLEQRQLDTDDMDALFNATGFAAKLLWTTGTSYITGTYPNKLYVQFTNTQYVTGDPEALGNKRRHGATLNFRSSTADGTTADTTITVVNGTSSYN